MIGNAGNNLLNTNIGGQSPAYTAAPKTTVNKYYNIFSKKMEAMELPDIDLEYNAVLLPEKTTFMRTA